jgi:hypothetical protein
LAICNHSDSRKLPTSHQGRGCGRIMARRGGTPKLQVRWWGERSETLCSSTITKYTLYSLYFDIIKLLRSQHGYLTTAGRFFVVLFPLSQPWLTPPPTSQTESSKTRISLQRLGIHLHQAQWFPYLPYLRAWRCDKPPSFRLPAFLKSNATSARRVQSERKFRMHIY